MQDKISGDQETLATRINNILKHTMINEEKQTNWHSNRKLITEADLKLFFKCPYAYHLKKNVGLNKLPRSAFAAQAMLFEQKRKKLLEVKDGRGHVFPGPSVAGPELKLAQDMDSEELRQYLNASSATAFGSTLFMHFIEMSKRGKSAGSDLTWSYPGQPGKGGAELKRAGRNYFNFVVENGAPIFGFVNKKVHLVFEDNLFEIKLPEVRAGMIIDDVTLWGFSADFPTDKRKNDIDTSSLVTLRILAYCNLIKGEQGHFRRKLKVPEEIYEELKKSNTSIDERVRYRHFNATKNQIIETIRTDSALNKLSEVMKQFNYSVSREDFKPDHRHCTSCQYNTLDLTGRIACPEIKKGLKPSVPRSYFTPDNLYIRTEYAEDHIIIKADMIIGGKTSKPVAKHKLRLRYRKKDIVAVSEYDSNARGLGFEEMIIKYTAMELQRLADNECVPVRHDISFKNNFRFAGQKKLRELISEMEYEKDIKIYPPKDVVKATQEELF